MFFKCLMTIQLFAEAKFHGSLKMTVNKKVAISSMLAGGFEKM